MKNKDLNSDINRLKRMYQLEIDKWSGFRKEAERKVSECTVEINKNVRLLEDLKNDCIKLGGYDGEEETGA